MSPWGLASAGARGNQDLPLPGGLGSGELVYKILLCNDAHGLGTFFLRGREPLTQGARVSWLYACEGPVPVGWPRPGSLCHPGL